MELPPIIVPLLAFAILTSGCASSDSRYGSNEYPVGSAHSNENHYAVIDSIKSGSVIGGAVIGRETGQANGQQAVYFIRVRFDDRTYRTVTQSSLAGLRVGDSVRIEGDRVRRY
jgi:outer membrane lipoprotein SlyB